jgi:uncharacterized membrane protein (DUF485 family)
LKRRAESAILRHTVTQQKRSSPALVSESKTDTHRASIATARAHAHRRVALAILTINGGLYAALILLIAFDKAFLARLVAPGLTIAIVFGTVVTIAAWLLTLVYVRWANSHDHAPGSE